MTSTPSSEAIGHTVGRCGSCRFSTDVGHGRYGADSLCCHRYPPSIHRKWFRLIELYPDVHARAGCGEWRASLPLTNDGPET